MKKDSQTLENLIERLSVTVDKLSSEDIELESAIKLYKEGMQAANKAKKMLDEYENEIKILTESENTENE